MDIDLSIVIVSWNVVDLLRECLDSICAAPDTRLDADGALYVGERPAEVYVVDNASSDGSAEMVRERFPWVKLIASRTNTGFTGGNNLALRRCRGRYLLLLNPDTRVVEDALSSMLGYMMDHPNVGVVGPRLTYSDGSAQSSRRRFPTMMMALMESTLLALWFPNNRWARAYHMADMPDDLVQEVDWVTGACMLVRREVIEQVGLMDERFFMYSEELDWCRRMADAGWRAVYYPRAVVMHYEGKSSGQVVAARQVRFETSKVLYFRKHHGRIKAGFLRVFLLGTYVLRIMEEGAKYLLGHKRSLRKPRIKAYIQVLRSGLRP